MHRDEFGGTKSRLLVAAGFVMDNIAKGRFRSYRFPGFFL